MVGGAGGVIIVFENTSVALLAIVVAVSNGTVCEWGGGVRMYLFLIVFVSLSVFACLSASLSLCLCLSVWNGECCMWGGGFMST